MLTRTCKRVVAGVEKRKLWEHSELCLRCRWWRYYSSLGVGGEVAVRRKAAWAPTSEAISERRRG